MPPSVSQKPSPPSRRQGRGQTVLSVVSVYTYEVRIDRLKNLLIPRFLAFNTWPCAKTPPFCHPLRVLEASDHFGRNKWVLCLKKMEIKRWAPEKKGWDADSHRVIEIPPNPSGEGRHVEIHLDTGK